MRISDWSSDVCSSDLLRAPAKAGAQSCPPNWAPAFAGARGPSSPRRHGFCAGIVVEALAGLSAEPACLDIFHQQRRGAVFGVAGRALKDRMSVVWGKSVSVRVDLGGRRRIKKKKK